MTDKTVVKSSPEPMRVGEAIAFTIDFTDQGTPSSPTVTAYDATGTDKSGDVLSGSASVSGDVVTLTKFTPASAQTYRLICEVTISGNTVMGIVDVEVIAVSPAVTITNGYATLPEFKSFSAPFASTDSTDDNLMADLIESASRYVDRATGRTFYARTETHYFSLPNPADRELLMDDDLLTVTTLTNGDDDTIASTEYNLVPRNYAPYYAIKLKEATTYYWTFDSDGNSEDVISVAGTWGYSAATPHDINLACLMVAASYYKRRFGENLSATSTITGAGIVISPMDVPHEARAIMNAYRKRV